MSVLGYKGFVGVKKTGGSASALSGQRNVLCTSAFPDNPKNNAYPTMINIGGYNSNRVLGRRTPTAVLNACMKPYDSAATLPGSIGWSDALIFNSLVGLGSDNLTDKFALGFKDSQETAIWDWSRCNRIYMRQDAMGGPLMVQMNFLSRWGNDAPYSTTLPSGETVAAAPTFTTPAYPDAGDLTSVADTLWTGFNGVQGWELTIMRGQVYEVDIDQTFYAYDITSTILTGALVIRQRKDASQTVADSGTASILVNGNRTSTTGRFRISLALAKDDDPAERNPGRLIRTSSYTLVDLASGGSPITFVAE